MAVFHLCLNLSFSHDKNPGAHPDDFLQLRRYQDAGNTLNHQGVYEMVDLFFGVHVYPPGGLVKN